jgi:alkane 1-monooxygenase
MSSVLPSPLPARPYRDRKRYAWLFSFLLPTSALAGPAAYLATGAAWTLWLPLAITYGLIPLLDWALGEDLSNPPESAVPALEADHYYRLVTWFTVPLVWAVFVYSAWFAVTQPLGWGGMLAVAIASGGVGAFGINLAHELGHKRTRLEVWLARMALALTGYGHFTVEHNRGHHHDVSTPHDCASARMGESVYRFVLREMPGGARRAWRLEAERLARQGRSAWSLANQNLPPALITLALWGGLVAWLGWRVLPFLLVASLWSNFNLTLANYVEHYGLLRRRLADGRWEPCQPHHSWNSNHVFSNWALFHLQRHSDHHAHPLRRYQSLRNFPDLPRLPSGYAGIFPIAMIPPLWFRLMDERLLGVVEHDPLRINFEPRQRAALMKRYGLALPEVPGGGPA